MSCSAKILVATAFDGNWRWLERHFEEDSYIWTFHRKDLLHLGRKALVRHAMQAAWRARQHDVIVTHGPWLTLFTAFFLKIFMVRRPHLAFTFNHGNGIFFEGLMLRLARWVLPTVDYFVTHSTYECALLSEKYGIPIERMQFTHWAVDYPDQHAAILGDEPYVCCIGRNNRDFPSFIEALEQTGVKGVIVCRKSDADFQDLPDNVTVYSDLSLQECQALTQHALASVIPLIDDSTGAGHMTIVMSLLYGTPVIVTDSAVVSDYAIAEKTALLVPRGDPDALANSILLLKESICMQVNLRRSCLEFANENLTETAAAAFLRKMLQRAL